MTEMKGLIIDSPYIENILSGRKTWEMRSRPTSVRGTIGLIKKGTGMVYGVADLVETRGPFTSTEMLASNDFHQISETRLSEPAVAKWNIAWVLRNVRPLKQPVAYHHPNGAVIWVNLDAAVSEQIMEQSGKSARCTAGGRTLLVEQTEQENVGRRPAEGAVRPAIDLTGEARSSSANAALPDSPAESSSKTSPKKTAAPDHRLAEVWTLFRQSGFRLTKETKKVGEFETGNTGEVVYFRKERLLKASLFVVAFHPRLNVNAFLARPGIRYIKSAMIHSSNMGRFPKVMHGGQNEIPRGIQVEFESLNDLGRFLQVFREVC